MKNINKIIVALLVLVLAGFIFTQTKPKGTTGDKSVEITIINHEKEAIFKETIETDALMLGDFIDEMNEDSNVDLNFVYEGSKDDEFGRYIIEINELRQDKDELKGYFWVYDAQDHEQCEDFCPGVDELTLNEKNQIEFKLTNEFN